VSVKRIPQTTFNGEGDWPRNDGNYEAEVVTPDTRDPVTPLTATNQASPLHPHEPQTPPVTDPEGRCLVCGVEVRLQDIGRIVADLARSLDAARQSDGAEAGLRARLTPLRGYPSEDGNGNRRWTHDRTGAYLGFEDVMDALAAPVSIDPDRHDPPIEWREPFGGSDPRAKR
jgi:hypothetical protein